MTSFRLVPAGRYSMTLSTLAIMTLTVVRVTMLPAYMIHLAMMCLPLDRDQEIDTRVEYTTPSYNGDRGNGDGILVNGGADHLIRNNLAQHNERYGLHPAGELTRGGVWRDNNASENGSNGFHFCWNNFDILVTGNTLNNNGRSGVGGLGRGGEYADRFNIATSNTATGNWRYGIEMNGGRDNVITFNDVRDNRRGGILLIGNHTVSDNLEN